MVLKKTKEKANAFKTTPGTKKEKVKKILLEQHEAKGGEKEKEHSGNLKAVFSIVHKDRPESVREVQEV